MMQASFLEIQSSIMIYIERAFKNIKNARAKMEIMKLWFKLAIEVVLVYKAGPDDMYTDYLLHISFHTLHSLPK